MKYFLALMILLVADNALAKRGPALSVPPLEYDGIRYIAPNKDGRIAYVQAYQIKTGKHLWTTEVFRNIIDSQTEEDVQWVFIKKLEIVNNNLVVTDERNRIYKLDPKTGCLLKSE
jgi:hypothetical protein